MMLRLPVWLTTTAVAIGLAAPATVLAQTTTTTTTTTSTVTTTPAIPAPANDARADATIVTALPATLTGTTVGATRDTTEPYASCGCNAGSVWYRYDATADGRLVVSLEAAGDLDAVASAFTLTRSQLSSARAEQTTDEQGKASIAVPVKAGQTLLVRVAQLGNSAPGTFRLSFGAAAPPVHFPGARLPRGGVTEALDAVLRPREIVSYRMVPGRSYRVAISPDQPVAPSTGDEEGDDDAAVPTVQDCGVRLALYAPASRVAPVKQVGCDGYFLYTPGRGDGGLYSLRTTVPAGTRGVQRYHLEVAPATANDTAPGVFLGNHRRVRGALQGTSANRVDLYRFSVARRSQLKLDLGGGAGLALSLRTDRGRRVSEPGAGESIALNVPAGRYFVAVTAPAGAAGKYVLTRSSRTITRTGLSFGDGRARPGERVGVGVRVRPAAAGSARVTYERFDPIAGWLYVRTDVVAVRRGVAGAAFVPPAVGRYRARVEYLGSLDSAESASRFGYLLVTDGG